MRYAARLFASLVAVTAVGGGLVGLGLALGWPGVLGSGRIASALGSASGGVAYTAAGGVVLLVGIGVLAVGYLAAGYKLVADAFAAGIDAGATSAGEAEAAAEARSVPGLDESQEASGPSEDAGDDETGAATAGDAAGSDGPAESTDPSPGGVGDDGSPASGTADEPAGVTASAESADPPEMSPEEIAFGSTATADSGDSVDDESAEEESFDQDEADGEFLPVEETEDVTNVRPAGSGASSDPLGDPTEDD